MNKRFVALKTLSRVAPKFWSGQIRQPIFILGCARSGTTLLATLLSYHRDVADWSEANEVWDPDGHPWRLSARETPPVWIDPVSFIERWWRDAEPRQEEIRSVFGAHQFLQGKSRFSNKTPYNTLRIPQVLSIFPDARLINIVRDGRAVVYSYLQREVKKIRKAPAVYDQANIPSAPDEIAVQLAAFWKFNVEEVRRQDDLLHLTSRGQLLDLKYEDLCSDTANGLKLICEFATLDPDRFDTRVSAIATPDQNYKWKSVLEDTLVSKLVSTMEPALSASGYEV